MYILYIHIYINLQCGRKAATLRAQSAARVSATRLLNPASPEPARVSWAARCAAAQRSDSSTARHLHQFVNFRQQSA